MGILNESTICNAAALRYRRAENFYCNVWGHNIYIDTLECTVILTSLRVKLNQTKAKPSKGRIEDLSYWIVMDTQCILCFLDTSERETH